jgi:hypothetical protein
MRLTVRPCAALIGIILSSTPASPQAVPSGQADSQKVRAAAGKPARRPAADDPLAEQRRATALGLLTSLAADADEFRDPVWRTRAQARAANLLWDFDRERAVALFHRAWDAAEKGDLEAQRKAAENRRQGITSTPGLRREVLKLVARRDRALGEEFFGRLSEAKGSDAAATVAVRAEDPASLISPLADTPRAKRLSLAGELLQAGDVARAIEFADPALDRVSLQAVAFLSSLRPSNAEAADRRYSMLLERAGRDPLSDANTVSLLSSYAFTPLLFVLTMPGGGPMTAQVGPQTPAPNLPASLRAAFFNVASRVLLRPLNAAELNRTTAGVAGTLLILTRLSPLFERYAPEHAATLQARIALLRGEAPQSFPGDTEAARTQGLVPPEARADEVQSSLEQLSRTSNARERDRLLSRAALAAAASGDPRAVELADEISADDVRKKVRAYVDLALVRHAIQKGETSEAIRLAKSGDITRVQRVWAYTAAAQQLMKSDVPRALELLEDALTEARRIDPAEADRVRSLVAVATQFYGVDRGRAWEVMNEVTKAANTASAFTGEGGGIMTNVETAEGTLIMSFTESGFDLAGIFGLLAKDHLLRAIELAKAIGGESPRAVANLAIAQAVLDETPDAKK